MKAAPPSFLNSKVWRNTLSPRQSDPYGAQRELLRNEYLRFRDRAADVAAEISRDLPDFTVHDEAHLDALWNLADLIGPSNYVFSPLEAFVLGGAFLVHDLGMGAAAYPDGVDGFPNLSLWPIARRALGIDAPDDKLNSEELTRLRAYILRELHGERAESLPTQSWMRAGNAYHLIEDPLLREQLGPMIGTIAASHWWPFERVRRELDIVVGPPAQFPADWKIDKLLLACMMRGSDAAHLDSLRAPSFLFALRRITGTSELHWNFQNKLLFPRLDGDRLQYSCASRFETAEADSWWLAYDAINLVHKELTSIDDFLSRQQARPVFAARGVIGALDPESLALSLHVNGWLPVDATPAIDDVASLVESLGGKHLYGDKPEVPVRELLQNAVDAYQALRILQPELPQMGQIDIGVEKRGSRFILSVSDNGIGMSQRVVLQSLLRFGKSLWSSLDLLRSEFPFLAEKSFRPMGRWGIGFFSVFMLADRVTVYTRRYQSGAEGALALEFRDSLRRRPILRCATPSEAPYPCGTRVVVELEQSVADRLAHGRVEDLRSWLIETTKELAPFVPAVVSDVSGGKRRRIIDGNPWVTMHARKLLRRAQVWEAFAPTLTDASDGLVTAIVENDGTVVGRARLAIPGEHHVAATVISEGGIRLSEVPHCAGVFVGEPLRASRDSAKVVATWPAIERWAITQRDLMIPLAASTTSQKNLAWILESLDTDTRQLPIATASDGDFSAEQLGLWAREKDYIIIVGERWMDDDGEGSPIVLDDNVLMVESGVPSIREALRGELDRFTSAGMISSHPIGEFTGSLTGLVVRVVAEAWDVDSEMLRDVSIVPTYRRRVDARIGSKGNYAFVRSIVAILRRTTDVILPEYFEAR